MLSIKYLFALCVLIIYFILGLQQPIESNQVDVELLMKIKSLRDRLRDAEFQNSARSQELISLKAQLTEMEAAKNTRTKNKSSANNFQNLSRIVFDSQSILRLPSIYNFMPHLMDSQGSLKPALHISRDRQGGEPHIVYLLLSQQSY